MQRYHQLQTFKEKKSLLFICARNAWKHSSIDLSIIHSFLNLTNHEQVEPNKATYKKFSFHSLSVCHEHYKMRQQKSLDTIIAIIYCYFENATIRLFCVILTISERLVMVNSELFSLESVIFLGWLLSPSAQNRFLAWQNFRGQYIFQVNMLASASIMNNESDLTF